MAFITKDVKRPAGSSARFGVIDQWIQVTQPAIALPASTTGQIFRVKGGRVRVKALVARVGTIIQAQACNIKFSSKALTDAAAAAGTAVDVASNLDINALEALGSIYVEGDGTAAVKSTAGAVLAGTNSGEWIANQGEIYVTTDATNTGTLKYDLWYLPLDAGAYVEAATLTSSLLTAAI